MLRAQNFYSSSVPYILMEIPMNLLMKRIGANITLPTMVILWGIVCACQGLNTFAELHRPWKWSCSCYQVQWRHTGDLLHVASSWERWKVVFFMSIQIKSYLALAELAGGIFPGIVLYLSSFYKRHVLQTRFSLMFSVTSLAGAFSGLLAAASQNMDGIRGLTGWAWIFILVRPCMECVSSYWLADFGILQEGVFTTAFGLISMFFMPATPADMPWLTNDEKTIYLRELAEDWSGDDETDMFSWSEVWSVFVDGPHV